MSKEARRVLQVMASLGRGGAEALVVDLYKHIDRSNIQFDFCVPENMPDDHLAEIQELGATVYYYPRLNGRNIATYVKWWNGFFTQHNAYVAVHGHVHTTASIYLKIAKKHGLRTVCHSHTTKIREEGRGIVNLALRKQLVKPLKTAKWIDVRLACSKLAGEWLYGENAEFTVIKNAIDIDRYVFNADLRKRVRNSLGINDDVVMGHVGSGAEAKNHAYLLEVYKHFHNQVPNSQLLLVGNLGERKKYIEQYSVENDLEDCVTILGVRDDVPELMMSMDCFCFPSTYEGLGIVLIEAQATGLPCVATDLGIGEADIGAGLVNWLQLDEGSEQWASHLADVVTANRCSPIDKVIASGYSINDVAEIMKSIYLGEM